MALFGAVSIVLSMVVLSRYEPGMSSFVAAAGLGLAGIGMGAAAPVLTASVANAVDDADLGVAGAAQQMLQQVGLVIGVQVLQAVQAVYEGDAVPDGASAIPPDAARRVIDSYHLAFAAATGLALLGLFAALSLPRASEQEVGIAAVSQPQ
jgi:MFS family permease